MVVLASEKDSSGFSSDDKQTSNQSINQAFSKSMKTKAINEDKINEFEMK